MKIPTIAVTLLATAIPFAAFAGEDSKDSKDLKEIQPITNVTSDAGFYVGVYGGVNYSTNYGNRRSVYSGGGANADVTPDRNHSDIGGVGGIKFGYKFNSVPVCDKLSLQPAIEAEALYIGNTDTIHGATPILGGGYVKKDSYNSAGGFVNSVLYFKNPSKFTPYLGVGIGVEYITSHGDISTGFGKVTGINSDSVDPAVQGLAGVNYDINSHWTLFTEYKFIDAFATNLKTSDVAGSGIDYRFKPDQVAQQIATVGLKYNF